MTLWYVEEPFTDDERAALVAVLHEPRRAGLRARQPARGREGRALRPILANAQVAAPAVPRRVRRGRRRRAARRATSATERAEKLYDRVFVEYGDDSVAQLGGVHLACEQASQLLAQGDRVGTPRRLPRAVDAVHALRRQAGRPLAAHGAAGDRRLAGRGDVRRVRRPLVRGVRPDVRPDARVLRRALPEGRRRLRLRVPIDDPGEDVRHAPRAAPGGDALEPRRLRDGPVLRADAPAHARAPARRGARVRGPHAHRAAKGDPGVPQARRPSPTAASRGRATSPTRASGPRRSRRSTWRASSPAPATRSRSSTSTRTAR